MEEIELKLRIAPSAFGRLARTPLLKNAQWRSPRRMLTNIYFDTTERDLHARRVALRLRKQGRLWLQTVKQAGTTAGGLSQRPEWEQVHRGRWDFSQITDTKLARLLTRYRDLGRLQPVFETRFARDTWHISHAGSSLQLMADRGEIRCGARVVPLTEIELELVSGNPLALYECALALAESLPLVPDDVSKAERGYALLAARQPAPRYAQSVAIDADTSPSGALRRLAEECLAHMHANADGAASGADPEYVHQMRVALRRLRSVLRSFEPCIAPELSERFLPRWRALAATLGEGRDWDVIATEILPPLLADDRELTASGLADRVAEARAAAQARLRSALAEPSYGRLLLEFGAMLWRLDSRQEGQSGTSVDGPTSNLSAFAVDRLRRARKQVAKKSERALTSMRDADLHALRIAIKRLRYALDSFAPLLPVRRTRAYLKALSALQSDLGSINDLATTTRRLLDIADGDRAMTDAVVRIAAWHGERARRARKRLPEHIRALSNSPLPW
ncbi:MAG TPA: CHAD domain-containing protein [Rhodocyclaceae bacterium]|nr:CHAD domain-containing protein [Rhodocyclaceae bacterium]